MMKCADRSTARLNRKSGVLFISYSRKQGNERGIALIMALVLLVILTLLGIWALDTSSTDLKIAGNYRNAATAFSMADSAVTYASNPTNLTAACLLISACTNSTGTASQWSATESYGSSSVTVTVIFLSKGPLPPGSMYDADVDANGNPKFSGIYFSAVASDSGPNNAQSVIERNIIQVVSN
ncbi:MAG TPA: PilX N-terminal domain-containing pilus assembly protein [Nitrospirota bacterium]|nr:PilX N-terminal domain-containing pilus assembly protein [Nitrospirota bacterium]